MCSFLFIGIAYKCLMMWAILQNNYKFRLVKSYSILSIFSLRSVKCDGIYWMSTYDIFEWPSSFKFLLQMRSVRQAIYCLFHRWGTKLIERSRWVSSSAAYVSHYSLSCRATFLLMTNLSKSNPPNTFMYVNEGKCSPSRFPQDHLSATWMVLGDSLGK